MMIPLVPWHRTPTGHEAGDDGPTAGAIVEGGVRRRAGYTLLELVIVLAIIVALAAVSLPALMRPWGRSFVQQAAQDLSRDLLKARYKAMQQGTPYQFRWREQTGDYEITAWQDDANRSAVHLQQNLPAARSIATGSAPAHRASEGRGDRSDPGIPHSDRSRLAHETDPTRRRLLGRLQHGVVFVSEEPRVGDPQDPLRALDRRPTPLPSRDSADLPPQDLARQPAAHHHPWNDPIWFFPDGRSSTADLLLRDSDGYTVRLELRGMTGTIRMGVVKQVELSNAIDGQLPRTKEEIQMPRPDQQTGSDRWAP